MKRTLILCKPIKAKYIPGETDIMNEREWLDRIAAYNAGKSEWPSSGHWEPEGGFEGKICILHLDKCADKRNRYATRYNRILCWKFQKFLTLTPMETLVIPAQMVLELQTECKNTVCSKYYRARYAVTKEDVVRFMRSYIKESDALQYKERILSAWEDGMVLALL